MLTGCYKCVERGPDVLEFIVGDPNCRPWYLSFSIADAVLTLGCALLLTTTGLSIVPLSLVAVLVSMRAWSKLTVVVSGKARCGFMDIFDKN